MPAFFISSDHIHGQIVTLSGPLVTHLQGSLRIKPGEQIRLTDERKRRILVQVTQVDRRTVCGTVLSEEAAPPPRAPRITLGQALLKGDHMDWVIQKATELGVDRIVPLICYHVVVRPRSARIPNQIARWQRIALEAAQQSERWDVPAIAPPTDLPTFLEKQADQACRMILLERTGLQTLRDLPLPRSAEDRIVLLVGPEGGWREAEAADALARGYLPIGLGPRILRAETAALTALSVLQCRLGELE